MWSSVVLPRCLLGLSGSLFTLGAWPSTSPLIWCSSSRGWFAAEARRREATQRGDQPADAEVDDGVAPISVDAGVGAAVCGSHGAP
jgi:hypothetical protein